MSKRLLMDGPNRVDYVQINAEGTIRRKYPKVKGKANVKAAKRQRRHDVKVVTLG